MTNEMYMYESMIFNALVLYQSNIILLSTTTITLKEIGKFFYVSHHISKMKNQFVKEFLQQQFIVRKFWCVVYISGGSLTLLA